MVWRRNQDVPQSSCLVGPQICTRTVPDTPLHLSFQNHTKLDTGAHCCKWSQFVMMGVGGLLFNWTPIIGGNDVPRVRTELHWRGSMWDCGASLTHSRPPFPLQGPYYPVSASYNSWFVGQWATWGWSTCSLMQPVDPQAPLRSPLLQAVGPLLPLVAALACAAAVGASCATFRRLRGAASQDSVGSGGGPPSSTLHVPPSPYLTPPLVPPPCHEGPAGSVGGGGPAQRHPLPTERQPVRAALWAPALDQGGGERPLLHPLRLPEQCWQLLRGQPHQHGLGRAEKRWEGGLRLVWVSPGRGFCSAFSMVSMPHLPTFLGLFAFAPLHSLPPFTDAL